MNRNYTCLPLLALSVLAASAEEAPRDTTFLRDIVVTAPAKTNVELTPMDVTIIGESEIERSTESSLLPIMVNKVSGLFVSERGFAGYGISGGAAGTARHLRFQRSREGRGGKGPLLHIIWIQRYGRFCQYHNQTSA